ncbi:Protein RRC1 [Diplonema papillatum]|nr:Protein RRC1 [Diplonema papillatum]WGM49966.1 U2SURP-1 [Diplonema papillatum]
MSKRKRQVEEEEEKKAFLESLAAQHTRRAKRTPTGEPDLGFVRGTTSIVDGVAVAASAASRPGELWLPPKASAPPSPPTPAPPAAAAEPPGGRKRPKMMDAFLRELKQQNLQQQQQLPLPLPPAAHGLPPPGPLPQPAFARPAPGGIPPASLGAPISKMPGSTVVYDGESSNICVENFDHRRMTAESIIKRFAKYGAVSSLKIYWPKRGEEHTVASTKAYINFLHQRDAVHAVEALNNADFCGTRLLLSWSRAVGKPRCVVFVNPNHAKEAAATLTRIHGVEDLHVAVTPEKLPEEQRQLIDAIVPYVVKHGSVFESAIQQREAQNPHFGFLTPSLRNPAHVYYKWRVYSLLQKDTFERHRDFPFQMVMNGPLWIPPKCPDWAAAPVPPAAKGDLLSSKQKEEWFNILRKLTTENASIRDAMLYALDHGAQAQNVCDVLADALSLAQTAPELKLARLFLVSDILYNSGCSAPKAMQFRRFLELKLPAIFDHLKTAISQHPYLRNPVVKVLKAWSTWGVFPDSFLDQLRDKATL